MGDAQADIARADERLFLQAIAQALGKKVNEVRPGDLSRVEELTLTVGTFRSPKLLAPCTGLPHLSCSPVSAERVDWLEQQLPECEIEFDE